MSAQAFDIDICRRDLDRHHGLKLLKLVLAERVHSVVYLGLYRLERGSEAALLLQRGEDVGAPE